MVKAAIKKLIDGRDLTEVEIMGAMDCIMEGEATEAQIGCFITALRLKGETIEEITGCARVMREKAERLSPISSFHVDTCGTGGDGANTFNISTASAIVASAGGVVVAKHGNRAVSSNSGSADVLEALGVDISLSAESVRECIDEIGIGFMFAPMFHKSMKYAAGPRKEIGIRTIFNILGPLANPANAKGQVLGVFAESLTEPIAGVLQRLGSERALVIHGMDGLDEITTTCATKITELKNGKIRSYVILPEDFGITRSDSIGLKGEDAESNARAIKNVLAGERGAKRDITILNAAAALYVGKIADSLCSGVSKAREAIDSGKAEQKLAQLVEFTQMRSN